MTAAEKQLEAREDHRGREIAQVKKALDFGGTRHFRQLNEGPACRERELGGTGKGTATEQKTSLRSRRQSLELILEDADARELKFEVLVGLIAAGDALPSTVRGLAQKPIY